MKSAFHCLIVMFSALFLLAGCSDDPIEIVKKGTLRDYPTTTVGKAFDCYKGFSRTAWGAETLPNGTRIVRVTAEVPKSNWLDQRSYINLFKIPAIDKTVVEVTFILNADDTFKVDNYTTTYVGSDLAAIEKSCRETSGQMTESGCKILGGGMIKTLFDPIYSNKPIMF